MQVNTNAPPAGTYLENLGILGEVIAPEANGDSDPYCISAHEHSMRIARRLVAVIADETRQAISRGDCKPGSTPGYVTFGALAATMASSGGKVFQIPKLAESVLALLSKHVVNASGVEGAVKQALAASGIEADVQVIAVPNDESEED